MYPTVEQREAKRLLHYALHLVCFAFYILLSFALMYSAAVKHVMPAGAGNMVLMYLGMLSLGIATWLLCTAKERAWAFAVRPTPVR